MLPQTGILAVFVVVEQETTRLPVRSALFKQRTGGLVVRWVTTGESSLLNVFFFLAFCIAVCFTFAGPWSHQVVGVCKLIL
jgi:hypothetical protein